MTKIILNGCCGKMGTMIINCALENPNLEIVAGIDVNTNGKFNFPIFKSILDCKIEGDVVIDFSRPSSLNDLINYCMLKDTPIVLCTTGFSNEQIRNINSLSEKVPVFRSANMSVGINIINNLLKDLSKKLYDDYDIEIIEKHHNQKVDSPSGTALLLADTIKKSTLKDMKYVNGRQGIHKREHNEIGIHSIRCGNIVGDHTVVFAGAGECIELTHKAISREVFAIGALKAALFISNKKPGKYNMDDMINN